MGRRKKEEVLAAKEERVGGGLGATRGWENALSGKGVTVD